MSWDTLVRGALVFDGHGGAPVHRDVAIEGGRIAALGESLNPGEATEVVDAEGRWLTPGLWDIHTHLDLEVELDPGLSEVVRHGTTTAVVANCSIGVPFGRQNQDGHDPVVSCFARVENIPKSVLRRVADRITWDDPKSYLEHFETMPLGANIVPMIPHSMLRIEAMGLDRAISEAPSEQDLENMEAILEKAMEDGYAGFSTDMLPFHYLSDDPHREVRIPANHAPFSEVKRLTNVVRKHGRVWQATPEKDKPQNVIRWFMLSSGRFFGKPLKVTAVAALDVVTNRSLAKLGVAMTRIINSRAGRRSFPTAGAGCAVSGLRRWDDHPARGREPRPSRAQRHRPGRPGRAHGAPERPRVLRSVSRDVEPRQEGCLSGALQARAQHDG